MTRGGGQDEGPVVVVLGISVASILEISVRDLSYDNCSVVHASICCCPGTPASGTMSQRVAAETTEIMTERFEEQQSDP